MLYQYANRLEFMCTNNVAFKSLLLGIEQALTLTCKALISYNDSKLVVKLVKKIYLLVTRLSNATLKQSGKYLFSRSF